MMNNYTLPISYDKLSPKQRREVRLQYVYEQNNLCMYCKQSLDKRPPKDITEKKNRFNVIPSKLFISPNTLTTLS